LQRGPQVLLDRDFRATLHAQRCLQLSIYFCNDLCGTISATIGYSN
jgi:hypothetical protein